MSIIKEFWSDGRGFTLLLVIMILTTISAQFALGVVWVEILFIRFAFLLFTIIAITSSILSPARKKVGYTVATLIFLFSISLIEMNNTMLIFIHGALQTIFMLFVMYLLVSQIFDGEKMTIMKIGGGIAVYLMIGHLWTSLYLTTYQIDPSAFLTAGGQINLHHSLRQLSYFSFVTLTTTGYGDITAISPTARTLVIFESLFGQLFPAIFIASLVSQHIEDSKK